MVKSVNRFLGRIIDTLAKCCKKHMPPIETPGQHPLLERLSVIERQSELADQRPLIRRSSLRKSRQAASPPKNAEITTPNPTPEEDKPAGNNSLDELRYSTALLDMPAINNPLQPQPTTMSLK